MDIDKLKAYGKVLRYREKHQIFEEEYLVGDPCAFLILNGRVELIKRYTPMQKEIFSYGEGDLFGLLEVFTGTARTTRAVPVVDSDLLAFSRQSLERAMMDHAPFALMAIRNMSKILRTVNERIRELP